MVLMIDDYLIVADLHIGVEDILRLPFIDTSEVILKKLRSLIEQYAPNGLIIAGDVRDGFELNDRVLFKTRRVLSEIKDLVDELIVVRGNHDTFIRPILRRLDIKFYEREYQLGDILVIHGHKKPDAKAEKIIMGHIHPAVRLGNEVVPANVYGRSGDVEIVILKALTPVAKTRWGPTMDFSSPIIGDNFEVEMIEVELRGSRMIFDKKLSGLLLR